MKQIYVCFTITYYAPIQSAVIKNRPIVSIFPIKYYNFNIAAIFRAVGFFFVITVHEKVRVNNFISSRLGELHKMLSI